MNIDKDLIIEELEGLIERNRISLLQYESLRKNFNKMVKDVLGQDYYNMSMDVYDSDRVCCEDITLAANRTVIKRIFDLLSK